MTGKKTDKASLLLISAVLLLLFVSTAKALDIPLNADIIANIFVPQSLSFGKILQNQILCNTLLSTNQSGFPLTLRLRNFTTNINASSFELSVKSTDPTFQAVSIPLDTGVLNITLLPAGNLSLCVKGTKVSSINGFLGIENYTNVLIYQNLTV